MRGWYRLHVAQPRAQATKCRHARARIPLTTYAVLVIMGSVQYVDISSSNVHPVVSFVNMCRGKPIKLDMPPDAKRHCSESHANSSEKIYQPCS